MSIFKKLSLLLLITLISGCYATKEPANNVLDISLYSFDPAFWNEVPDSMQISVSVGDGLEKSPPFQIHKVDNKFEMPTDIWSVNYLKLISYGNKQNITLLSKDLDATYLGIFQGELASKKIDIESIPFNAPVLLTLQDNPSENRSFQLSTGAKIQFIIRRRLVKESTADLPQTLSMPWFLETWFASPSDYVSYEEYSEYYQASKKMVEETYGTGTYFTHDVNGSKTKRELSDLRAALQKYVKQKIRQNIKRKIVASLEKDSQNYEASKAAVFWDYLKYDQSKNVFSKLVVKTTTSALQSLIHKGAESNSGNWLKELLKKEITQDDSELEKYYKEAVTALQK